MSFDFHFYVWLLFFSAAIASWLGITSWRNRRGRLTIAAFAGLMFALSYWSFFQGLEIGVAGLQAKRTIVTLQYIGIVATVAMWFVFSVSYTGRDHLLTRRNLALLSIEPIFVMVLLFTDSQTQLFRVRVWLDSTNSFMLRSDYSIGFWLHAVYSYILLMSGTLLIYRFLRQSSKVYWRQTMVIIVGIFVPWLANLLFLLGFTTIDLTPFGFTVTGLVLAWGLLRFQLLDILPIARTAVFESLTDAILTIDDKNRIIDLNPAAETLLHLKTDPSLIGVPIEQVIVEFPTLFQNQNRLSEAYADLTLSDQAITTYLELHLSPIFSSGKDLVGRVLVIRDVTARRLVEKSEREQRILAEALRDAAAALNNSLNLDEVLDRILQDVGRVLPHDTANVMLLRGNTAHFVGYRGYSDQILETVKKRWSLDDTPNLRRMFETGKPVVISDVTKGADWVDTPATRWIRSYVGAPILHDGQVKGFINLDSGTRDRYQTVDGERLQAFASQAGIALGNAQLFAELQERNAELDAYARTIAHDLKSPLSLIYGYIELVSRYDLPPMGQAHLDIIQATVLRMEEMIDQLLLLAQLRDVMQTAVSVEILPLLYSVISRFTDQIAARSIIIDVAKNLPPLLGHAPWIEEIFANLISNAIKYIGADNQEPLIRIRAVQIENMVRCQIQDNGLGIKAADQQKLFDMFTRFHREEASGTGLGLPIVERIVRKLGGEVGVESAPDEGSTFWFTLPAGNKNQ
ncbi:MAG: GAF domain-containing protein [Chloroflexi bacterium]|nr:GAF domain-containing protein [Chloroflexota bacterium]MBP7043132.1 GAF domain-containing protein [Chloroflexota bacterium]